jgi:hypothetical protein
MGSIKGPLWTEFVLQKGGQDPLAMDRRAANRMSLELFWGMTVNTQIARYYAFYPWVIERSRARDRGALLDDIIRAEKAYAVACLLAHGGERCTTGIVGADLADDSGIGGKQSYTLPAIEWFSRDASGFGQLYQGPLYRLDLLKNVNGMIETTERGHKLARAYEQNVDQTDYAAHYFENDVVPAAVLTSYGHHACPCALLRSSSDELELLRALFFESRDDERELQLSHSLHLVLGIVQSCTEIGRPFDEKSFRLAVFYHEIPDAEAKDFHRHQCPDPLEAVRERWRMFQAEDYFVFALETFLSALLDAAEAEPDQKLELGWVAEELEEIDTLGLLEDYLHVSLDSGSLAELALGQIARAVLARVSAANLTAEASREFDGATSADSPWSETQIAQRLAPLNKARVKSFERVVGALALLLTLYLRFYQYHKKRPPAWKWYLARSSVDDLDLSLSKWMYQNLDLLRRRRSIFDFLVEFLDLYVLRRQLRVAEDRDYDAAWFTESDLSVILARKPRQRIYRFNYPYESASPNRLSSKLSNALDILHTLGYCRSDPETGIVQLTQDGRTRLSRI